MQKIPTFFRTILLIYVFTVTKSSYIPLNSAISTLNSAQKWSSPNDTFSLLFLPINDTAFSLAIAYDSSTPIWSPVTAAVPRGATFHLTLSGDLQLISSNNDLIWNSNTSNVGITHAKLDDNGNFMLLNSSNYVFWRSFDYPMNTIVTSQNFTVGMNLSSGFYSFSLSSEGNMSLQWNHSIVYYTSGVNSSVSYNLSGNPRLMLQEIGMLSLYDSNLTSSVIMAYGSDYGDTTDILRFLRLDSDGNLRLYSVNRGSDTAFVSWSAVADQCQVFGFCGNLGICSYNETGPVCGCASENFEPVDDGNARKGCRLRKRIEDCPGNVALLQLDHTRFLNYPPEMNDVYYMGNSNCRGTCLSGSTCVVSTALSDGSGQCLIKSSKFVSGYQSSALPSTSFVKVCGPVLPNPPPPSEESTDNKTLQVWIIVVAVLSTIVVIFVVEGSLWWLCFRTSPKFASLSATYGLLEYASGAPVQFSYRELQLATRGFKEKLGVGGFGAVYKGVLADRTAAAIKRLEGIEQGEKQFRMEVATIGSTHHLNLVRLIGFCSEGRHRLLVYEYMRHGSLDSFLFETELSSGKCLSWEHRFNIALGTAKGITYLHEECRDCIVHCDIKPENILLDDNYNAKVSDFGLAKLVNPKDHRHRTLTSVRGTRGYLAPEWLANHAITSKSDVYSLGMVLLELVSGKRNFEVSDDTNRKKFTVWAYEEFDKENMSNIIDRRHPNTAEINMEQVKRVIQVGFWCIQEHPSQRPTMGKVVQMLEGIIEIKRPPAPKVVVDGSVSGIGASLNVSGSISGLSTFNASGYGQSSSSSIQNPRDPSSPSGERPVSSIIPGEL
ncbi:hypothetical protein vseg_009491 [Gypsophila vaccaria]